jgi:hypothetical protein
MLMHDLPQGVYLGETLSCARQLQRCGTAERLARLTVFSISRIGPIHDVADLHQMNAAQV